jgi:hypothetical protein
MYSERTWVIERQYRDGSWWPSRIMGFDSGSHNFCDAHALKNRHQREMVKMFSWWSKKHFRVREYARLESRKAGNLTPNTRSTKRVKRSK